LLKKTDLRVIKTKKFIHDAFLKLMNEKGFEKITINDIAENAQVNRSTFYLHYTDKYNLLEEIVDCAIRELMTTVDPNTHTSEDNFIIMENLKNNIKSLLDVIHADILFYKAVLGKNGMLQIRQRIMDAIKEGLKESFQNKGLIPMDMLLDLVSAVYMETVVWWVNGDMRYSSAYVAEQLVQFLALGPVMATGRKGVIQ